VGEEYDGKQLQVGKRHYGKICPQNPYMPQNISFPFRKSLNKIYCWEYENA